MTVRLGSRYELHEVLGRGGSGEVWSATSPDGPVAVKVLRPELSTDPEIVDRFVAERSLLIGLKSPHIVGVRDLVIEGDRLGIVMDLVTGGDLRTKVREEKTLRPSDAIDTMAQVLDGLAAVHAAGVVHRDLKPENILLEAGDGPNRVRVADFGIARLSSATRATRTTGLLGTPRYVAPELAIRGRVTPSVDVYAAGVTFYETLFGRVPFDGPHPASVLRAHAEDAPYRPEGVPDALWDVIARMLEKNPSDRPTATEAAVQLRALTPAVAGLAPFPAMTRSGGPDTDDTYTTDPHGNVTDLTGIGRRGARKEATVPLEPVTKRKPWLVPIVAVATVVALIAGVVILRDGGGSGIPGLGFDDDSQGSVNVHHAWKFGSDRGDELDGTMTVSTANGRPFAKAASALAVFPPSLSNVKFSEPPKTQTKVTAASPRTAPGESTTVAQFSVSKGAEVQSFHYTIKVAASGTKIDRLDQWSDEMRAAAASLCTADNAPEICERADHLVGISFSTLLAPPIGPLQSFDASAVLQGLNKSGTAVSPGHVDGATWKSSDPTKATVDEKTGVVTGISAGPATITATVGDLVTNPPLQVTVDSVAVPVVTTLRIDGPEVLNGPAHYTASGYSDDGQLQPVLVIWSVSPTKAGVIVGAADGSSADFTPFASNDKVRITATTVNVEGKQIAKSKSVQINKVNEDPDGDGVRGARDLCANDSGPASNGGCPLPQQDPDGDGDGVRDSVDACKSQPGPASNGGCPLPQQDPDGDGDGVRDSVDLCPTQPESRTTDGCPKPDLIITRLFLDKDPVAGLDCVRFGVEIKNVGSAASPAVKHGVLFYVDGVKATWSDNSFAPLGVGDTRVLNANGGHGDPGCSADLSLWRAVSGARTVSAWVDDHSSSGIGLIDEISGANNRASLVVPVS